MSTLRSWVLCGLVAVGLVACGGGGGGGGSDAPPSTGAGGTTNPPQTVTAPAITTQPANQTVNDGALVRFSVAASGTAPFSIQWKRNGVDISGANSAFYDIPAVSMGDDGAQFSATISNSAGSTSSSAANLSVLAVGPRIVTAPQAQAVLAGNSATFTAVVTGTAPLSLQWRKNGLNIAGATGSSYTTPITSPVDNGSSYDLVITNAQGIVSSSPVALQVTPVPNAVTITSQPSNVSTTEGSAATFTVAATGTGPFTYQWLRNGAPIAGGYDSTLTIAPATIFDNGAVLAVEVSNALGTSTSATTNLSVTAGAISLRLGNTGGWGNLDGTAELARFASPCGVTADNAGNYFVSDTLNNTVRKISSTKVTTTVAGLSQFYGSADGTGSNARFNSPGAIAIDSLGNVFIVDTANQTVRWMWAGGSGLVTTLAGSAGVSGAADGSGGTARFNFEQNPITCSILGQSGIAVNSNGYIFVADSNNHAIRKITPLGDVTTFAGALGQSGSADGTAANARFNHPTGLAFDAAQNLYVVDRNAQLRKISPSGEVTSLPGSKPVSDGALHINSTGEIYLAGNSMIYKYDGVGAYSGIAGSFFTPFRSINGVGSAASFAQTPAITQGPGNNLLVADNYGLRIVNAHGQVSTFAGNLGPVYGFSDGAASTALANSISGLDTDASGNVYFTDMYNNTVRMLSAAGAVTTIAGVHQQAGSTDGPLATARFDNPKGIARDNAGNLYVSDRAEQTVRKIAADGTVTTIAGAAGLTGSTDGPAAASRLNSPGAVAVDASGNIYVLDEGNFVVRKISNTGTVSTIAGQAASSGAVDGTGNAARFSNLRDIAVDTIGDLFVTDNNAVRKITSGGIVTTFAGSLSLFGTTDGTAGAARFSFPTGIALDNAGNLFVVDGGNRGTIRKITSAAVVTTVAGNTGAWGIQLGALPGSFDAAATTLAILPSVSGTNLLVSQNSMLVQINLP